MPPMTKERLESYMFLRQEVANQEDRIKELENATEMPGRRDGDGAKHTPGAGDRQEKAIIRKIELGDEIQRDIEKKREEMAAIRAAISELENSQEREVLRLRYIDCEGYERLGWQYISNKLYPKSSNYEAKQQIVFRIHRKALKNIAKIEI